MATFYRAILSGPLFLQLILVGGAEALGRFIALRGIAVEAAFLASITNLLYVLSVSSMVMISAYASSNLRKLGNQSGAVSLLGYGLVVGSALGLSHSLVTSIVQSFAAMLFGCGWLASAVAFLVVAKQVPESLVLNAVIVEVLVIVMLLRRGR